MNGKQIRELREKVGLTQADLAVKLGVSTATIGNWERGDTMPDDEAILKLQQMHDVPANGGKHTIDAAVIGKTITVHRAGVHVVGIDEANQKAYLLSRG